MPGGTPANPALTTPGGHPDTSGGGPPTAQDLQLQPSTSPTHVDMFHEHQYASLLEAVSNIHMSARPFDLEDVDDNRDLDSRLTDRRTVTEEDIFDIHQVIVHRQREYEHQMRQVRPNYHFDGAQHDLLRATQLSPPPPGHSADDSMTSVSHAISSVPRVRDTPSPELLAVPASRESNGSLFSPSPPPVFGTFENRPTISSSYFPSSMESTIVLSSPPPGRPNYQSQTSQHNSPSQMLHTPTVAHHSGSTLSFGPSQRLQSSDTLAASESQSPTSFLSTTPNLRPSSSHGSYRPYVTGRELTTAASSRQDASIATPTTAHSVARNTMTGSGHESASMPIPVPSQQEELSDEMDSDGRRTLVGNHGTGRWSAFGSLIPLRASAPHLAEWSEAIHFQRQRQRHFYRHHRQSQPRNEHSSLPTHDSDVIMRAPDSDDEGEKFEPDIDDDPTDAQLERQYRRLNPIPFESSLLGYPPPPSMAPHSALMPPFVSSSPSILHPPRNFTGRNNRSLRGPQSLHVQQPSHLPIASRYLRPRVDVPVAGVNAPESSSLETTSTTFTSWETNTHTLNRSTQETSLSDMVFMLDNDEHDRHGGVRDSSLSPQPVVRVGGGSWSNSQAPYSHPHHQHHHHRRNNNHSRGGDSIESAAAPSVSTTSAISGITINSAASTSTTTTGSQTDASLPTPASLQSSSSSSSTGSQQGYRYYPPSYHAYFSQSGDHSSLQQRQIGLKEVVRIACRFCDAVVCERGMKAQLLADQTIGLFSTDDAPITVELIGDAYQPTNCSCEISDTACLVCGNAIGYHIIQPCKQCLSAENNGHLWLFHPEYVFSSPRYDPARARTLRWQDLPRPEQDDATKSLGRPIQRIDFRGHLVMGGMVRRDYDSICR